MEDALPYNQFHLDFGPLHIGSLYRFAVVLHNILNEELNQGKAIVFYSSTLPKERANAACLLCCYMVLVQLWLPHQVLQPIAQIEPPLQGFRDAGYSNADFEITIQDVVYGMWRAKERGMLDLTTFNLEEYEQYERVDQGDFNVITKDFIAFASPQQSARKPGPLNEPFQRVLEYFTLHDVQLVVRLNLHLYDAAEFTKRNIRHVDMIFDDGTCPTLDFVRKFIGAAECIINEGGKIAVHCKAGLGRTGCLIGAHLIYTHGFTASECIGYMRMIRPGMVVGPQQHWLYLHQNDFRDWRHTMCLDNRPDAFIDGLFSIVPYEEFKARAKLEARQRKANSLAQMDLSFNTPVRRRKISGALAAKIQTAVPADSPGQPRKYTDGNSNNQGRDDVINNSDDDSENCTAAMDVLAASRGSRAYEVDAEVHNADGSVVASPKNDWKVLRSISTNGGTQPLQLTKTTTTTTTRTVSTTLLSPPGPQSPSHAIRMPKSRLGLRVTSGVKVVNPTRVHSAGIRKVSGTSSRKF